MAPKKGKKSKEAKGSSSKDEENAIRDQFDRYSAAMNDKWEELGSRSRAGGSILKEEEMGDFLKTPEVAERLAKMRMGKLGDHEKLKDRAKAETMMKMMTIGSSQSEVFSNGDQSPVKGEEATLLRYQWAGGMGYNPTSEHLTDWMKALYKGDYSLVMKLLGNLSQAQASKLLEKRESLLNVSAVFHVIIGARCLYGNNSLFTALREKIENKKGHIKILSRLLEMGADLKAKDMAGYTPLHHCLTSLRNDTTLTMAEMLLKTGADPDLQNRNGCSPIFECIIAADVEAIKLLLKYGASTDVKEYDAGITPVRMASTFPKVTKLFSKAGMHKAKKMRAEQKAAAGGSFRFCGGGCGTAGTKRCTGCFMVLYCGEACQRSAWTGHSGDCKTSQAQYRPVDLVLTHGTAGEVRNTINYKTQKVYSHNYTGQPNKKHFVIKIQVCQQSVLCEAAYMDFMIYNEERSVMGFLKREGHEEIYDALNFEIRNRGVDGLKGFYYAIFKGVKKEKGKASTMQIKINSKVMLPTETW